MSAEPVPCKLCDLFQGSWLSKQVGGTLNHFKSALTSQTQLRPSINSST